MSSLTLIKESWPFYLGLFLGLFFITFSILGFNLEFLPGDLGDTRFNIYILEHAHQYFFTNNVPSDSYWDAPFFYPQPATISFSDNLLGSFLIYSFFRFLTFDIYTAFQGWMIVVTILNYSCAYLFFKYILKNKYAAVLGAFIFTFSIALLDQYVHPQTFPRFCVPLAFYFATKFLTDFNWKYLFYTSLVVVLQTYCVVYLGFMLVVPLFLFLLIGIIIKYKSFIKAVNIRWLLKIFMSLAISGAIIYPLADAYMNSPILKGADGEITYREYGDVFHTIPLLKSYLYTMGDTVYGRVYNDIGYGIRDSWNHQLFVGAFTILCLLFLVFYSIKYLKKGNKIPWLFVAFGLAGLLTFLIYLRTDTFSLYYYLIFKIPGFSAIRALNRIININLIFAAFPVAAVYLILSKKIKYKSVLFLAFLLIVILDNTLSKDSYKKFTKIEAIEREKKLIKRVEEISKDKVISYEPYGEDLPFVYHIDAMLVAQKLGFKTLNGYSSKLPENYYNYGALLGERGRLEWLASTNLKEEVEVVIDEIDPEILVVMEIIKSDKNWLEKVKKQALELNLPLQKNIYRNAIWIHNFDKQQNNLK